MLSSLQPGCVYVQSKLCSASGSTLVSQVDDPFSFARLTDLLWLSDRYHYSPKPSTSFESSSEISILILVFGFKLVGNNVNIDAYPFSSDRMWLKVRVLCI